MEIERGDVSLHVRVEGPDDGPTLVLVHGFPVDHRMWRHQIEAFAAHRRVVAYDVRGLGRSAVGDGQYTMELFVDDLFAILDAVASEPVAACGLSMGGYILLRALARRPERFRAAVLADTRSEADDDETRLNRSRAVEAIKEEGPGSFAEGFVPKVLAPVTLEERPEVVKAVEEMIRANDPRGMVGAQLAMMSRTDTSAALAELEIPVLAVAGEADELTPPEGARSMADSIPDGRAATVSDAGHFSPLENPEVFNRILAGFLEEVG